jgi:hypothetical protein
MRRRTLLVVLAGLSVVCVGGVVLLRPREDRITRANYDRIEVGMSRADVEAILGPPGDYRTGHGETGSDRSDDITWIPDPPTDDADTLANWSGIRGQSPEDARQWAGWWNYSFGVIFAIDESEAVELKLGGPRRMLEGQLENLLWRAKRQCQRWFP